MKDYDKQRITMDSSDDYDDYEEEIIERDEYVDDDEQYDDDYVDEEEAYDDEEPYDDDYADEEGYDDDYYDDRLSKVLDELADLKKGMTPAVVAPPPISPYHIYNQPPVPSAGSEVLMYNEISRLRDELSKTQNTQSLHLELTRLKDEMAKEHRYNENQLMAEIKRLNEKVEVLQKNELSPQGNDNRTAVNMSSGEGETSINVSRLISINEAILRTVKDTDAKVQSDISHMRSSLESIQDLSKTLKKSAKESGSQLDSEQLRHLLNEIAALKSLVSSGSGSSLGGSASGILRRLNDIASIGLTIDNSDVLKHIYELRSLIGNSSPSSARADAAVLDIYNNIDKLKNDIASADVTFRDKLSSAAMLCRKISDFREGNVSDAAASVNLIINGLSSYPVTRDVLNDLVALSRSNVVDLSNAKRDSVENFLSISDEILQADPIGVNELLPDLVVEKNNIQNNAFEDSNNDEYTEISDLCSTLLTETDDGRLDELMQEFSDRLYSFCELYVRDVVTLPHAAAPKAAAQKSSNTETLFNRLDELRSTLSTVSAQSANASAGASGASDLTNVQLKYIRDQLNTLAGDNTLLDAVSKLSEDNLAVIDRLALLEDNVLQSLQSNETSQIILEDLNFVRQKLEEQDGFFATINEIRDSIAQLDLTAYFDKQTEDFNAQLDKLYDDLSMVISDNENNIVSRLSEALINESSLINSAITDVTLNMTEVKESLAAAADEREKLLGDVTFLREQAEISVAEAAERAEQPDMIETGLYEVKDKLYSEFAALEDKLLTLDLLSDDLQQLKEAVNLAAEERIRLLDDIAYLRTQTETEIADIPEIREKLDLLTEQLVNVSGISEIVVQISEDSAALKDSSVLISEDILAIREEVNQIRDNNLLADEITALKESTVQIAEDVLAVRDEITQLRDNSALTEDIAALRESSALISEDVLAIREEINQIRDNTLLADDVVALKENTAQIGEDILAVREDVAQLRDNTALTEDIAALRENTALISEDVLAIREEINQIRDNPMLAEDLASLKESTAAVADEIVALREGNDAFAEEMTAVRDAQTLMGDDLAIIRDNSSVILESLNNDIITEEFAALKDIIIENNQAAQDTRTLLIEDVGFIRQKMEDAPDDSILADSVANIMEDLSKVLERLEVLETGAADDKVEILDSLNEIKESVHLNELGQNLDGVVQTDEERQTLLREIGDIRERLAVIEGDTLNLSESAEARLDTITAQLETLSSSLNTQAANDENVVLQTLDEINEKINALASTGTAESNEQLLDGIEQIKEQLLVALPQDLSEVLNDILDKLDSRVALSEGEIGSEEAARVNDENLAMILDEIAGLKQKISADSEYDMVAEILALREDLKASRIVDQNDVSSELEAVKNELAAISGSGILEEIAALREDIINYREGDDAETKAPTPVELNLVYNEIVSLRDEVLSFKEELSKAESKPASVAATETELEEDENITIILDELTAMRVTQGELNSDLNELKDLISRRTSINESAGENVASNELNIVLDEIINLKSEIDKLDERVNSGIINELALEVRDLKSRIEEIIEEGEDEEQERGGHLDLNDLATTLKDDILLEIQPELNEIADEIKLISQSLTEIQVNQAIAIPSEQPGTEMEGAGELLEELVIVKEELAIIREQLTQAVPQDDITVLADDLRLAIEDVKAGFENLRAGDFNALSAEINNLREAVDDLAAVSLQPTVSSDGETSYAALIDEIRELKAKVNEANSAKNISEEISKQLAALKDELKSASSANQQILDLTEQIAELREDLAAAQSSDVLVEQIALLREDMLNASSNTKQMEELQREIAMLRTELTSSVRAELPPAEYSGEITALKEEIALLKEQVAAPIEVQPDAGVMAELLELQHQFRELKEQLHTGASDHVMESLMNIKEDVRVLKDEPDLGVMSEILALRDEFQSLREEISDVKSIAKTPAEQSDVLGEVQSLRDQLFAISMANVNTGTDENVYESYNNIILDEITALREEMGAYASISDTRTLHDEIANIKEKLESYDKIAQKVDNIRSDIKTLKEGANNAILTELTELKTAIENQREADLTTLNFMSEMAHLLERQNRYISQTAGARITDEIESLKAEIAAAYSTPVSNVTNSQILEALSGIREDISRQKPSNENELILESISRLNRELTTFAEKDLRANREDEIRDEDLSKSLNDLRTELSQIAGIVETEKSTKKSASTSKSRSKSGGTKGSKKSGTQASKSKTSKSGVNSDELITKIESEAEALTERSDEYSLNIKNVQSGTADEMDLASRMAKQVANKLIMEQLVQQLSDGGVSDNRINEIVKDILPQEFSTIAMDSQSDKVRKLANSLVLDKLRARLTGGTADGDDE